MPTAPAPRSDAPAPQHHCEVLLRVNGEARRARVVVTTTLATLLRDAWALRGTKVACDQAACGACTVLRDGLPVFACQTLAVHARGADLVTVEGLAPPGSLSPLQQAFVDHDALQCGYCTPGMLITLQAALDAGLRTRDELAQAISGNLCRCGAYAQILDAAEDAAARR